MIQEEVDKKLCARLGAKGFLKNFKLTSLRVFTDLGILRSAKDLAMGLDFVPKLIGQAEHDQDRHDESEGDFMHLVSAAAVRLAASHSASILKEKKRRHDAVMSEKKRQRDEAEEKR